MLGGISHSKTWFSKWGARYFCCWIYKFFFSANHVLLFSLSWAKVKKLVALLGLSRAKDWKTISNLANSNSFSWFTYTYASVLFQEPFLSKRCKGEKCMTLQFWRWYLAHMGGHVCVQKPNWHEWAWVRHRECVWEREREPWLGQRFLRLQETAENFDVAR